LAIAAAIASNRSEADMPPSWSTERPSPAKAAWATFEPCDALTNMMSAFVAAFAIVSILTPARSPARASPENSPSVIPSRAASLLCWSITSAWACP